MTSSRVGEARARAEERMFEIERNHVCNGSDNGFKPGSAITATHLARR